MPGHNVNVWISNWRALGTTAPVPKYTVDLRIEWAKADDTPGTHTGTYTFPNVFSGVPLRRIRRYMEEIILCEARLALDIDAEEDVG